MLRLADLNIRPKLVVLFVLTGIIPLLIAGYYGSILATDALMEKSFSKLTAIQSIRTGQLEEFFTQRTNSFKLLAQSGHLREFTQKLIEYHNRQKALQNFDAREYQFLLKDYTPALERFISSIGCQSIKIIEAGNGHILFTSKNDIPIWYNLYQTDDAGTGLARAYEKVVETKAQVLIDFDSYAPARGLETAFFGEPINDKNGDLLAVAVIQAPPSFISQIMDSQQGMGKTGESYILDWDKPGNRFELRSNMNTMGDGKYVIGFTLDRHLAYWEDAVKKGFTGGSGIYVDSNGKSVLAAYNQLNIHGLNWFLISKIDKHEIQAPVRDILRKTFYLSIILVVIIGFIAFFISQTITRPIIHDVKFAQAIAQGKFHKTIQHDRKDELGALAKALNHMARTLHDLDWLKNGKQGLDDVLRGDLDNDELGRRLISYIAKHLDAQVGALYVNKNGVLKLTASYAFTDRSGNFNSIRIGEGMVGQAALEQEMIVFNDDPEKAPMIHYGLGQTKAGSYLIVPLVFEKQSLGVFLLGSAKEFSPLQRQFIEQNSENAAILMNMAKSRQTIKKLLDQAREHQQNLVVKNEALEKQATALKESEAELQAQQEELRVINEELEEQAQALKESEAELQAQQEELRVTNEELEEQNLALEEQKQSTKKKNLDLVKARENIQKKARELEIASKYKSEFLANMSHELRTPLNSILILSQLLAGNKYENLSANQIKSAQAIHSSGEDLLTLINEILDLSKVEAGKIELILEQVEIGTLVDDLKRMFSDLAREKKISFTINLDQGIGQTIYTDALRLQQILRNLLTNAFKFTLQGNVCLDISRPSASLVDNTQLSRDTSIALAVKDDGVGIPEEQQAAIFEAFQQADGSTSRKYGGTGLGLSISRELSKLLGGFIHLTSQEGKGSTFTIVIPERHSDRSDTPGVQDPETASQDMAETNKILTPDKVLARQKSREKTEEKKALGPNFCVQDKKPFVRDDRKTIKTNDKSLLIIEDDQDSAEIMRDFARERGFKCIIAEDGESGLYFADYYKPSAIILDIGLPGIDGWAVLERLKSNLDLRHIPVHFMSAADKSMDAMRMGAIGFLTKPVTMETVDQTFKRIGNIITRPVRRLLVVEDDSIQQKSIKELIGNKDVETTMVSTGHKAFEELTNCHYDCMILDLGLEDMSGFELLEKIQNTGSQVPVIVYTGRDLTLDEDKKLRKYTETIIIKGVKSPERLLEESALFLHRVDAGLPDKKQKMFLHDKQALLKDKTVLLVDDDMRNVFALSNVLEEKQMQVIIARDGIEGVEKVDNHKEIDIILMDIMMPKMDGYEAMKKIRKNHKALPIIALTAKAMKGDRNKCIEAGASDYLAKPVDTDKLISMLKVWLYA